jgi:SAM-dependent methyltransferase
MSRRLGALIQEIARALVAGAPAPRALPYLGLDHTSGTGFHLLDGLSARGIFRKYELVLAAGAGLGASARWLAARLGCEVVGTTTSAAEAAAAFELTRRTPLRAQVRFVPAAPPALPVRTERFTHAWVVEALPRLDAAAVIAETHRAVRPGGTLAIQELVRHERSRALQLPGWEAIDLPSLVGMVTAAGFVDLETRDVSADAAERSARVLAARDRLLASAAADPHLAPLVAERRALASALSAGDLRVVQVLARRP